MVSASVDAGVVLRHSCRRRTGIIVRRKDDGGCCNPYGQTPLSGFTFIQTNKIKYLKILIDCSAKVFCDRQPQQAISNSDRLISTRNVYASYFQRRQLFAPWAGQWGQDPWGSWSSRVEVEGQSHLSQRGNCKQYLGNIKIVEVIGNINFIQCVNWLHPWLTSNSQSQFKVREAPFKTRCALERPIYNWSFVLRIKK